jgi:hypothetical protein
VRGVDDDSIQTDTARKIGAALIEARRRADDLT